MAIKINQQGDKLTIELDNGHATSLKKVVENYNLKGEHEAVSFMLALMATAGGKEIKIDDTSYLPNDSLKKPNATDRF